MSDEKVTDIEAARRRKSVEEVSIREETSIEMQAMHQFFEDLFGNRVPLTNFAPPNVRHFYFDGLVHWCVLNDGSKCQGRTQLQSFVTAARIAVGDFGHLKVRVVERR